MVPGVGIGPTTPRFSVLRSTTELSRQGLFYRCPRNKWHKFLWFAPLVAGAGFEPATCGLWARRAARLLYPAIFNW